MKDKIKRLVGTLIALRDGQPGPGVAREMRQEGVQKCGAEERPAQSGSTLDGSDLDGVEKDDEVDVGYRDVALPLGQRVRTLRPGPFE